MPRYFFHVWNGEDYVVDWEGASLTDAETARCEATQSVREIVAECIITGRALGGRQLEITDEFGSILAVVPFRSVIRLE